MKLDPRARLISLAVFSTLLILLDRPFSLLLCFLAAVMVMLSTRPKANRVLWLGVGLLLGFWSLMLGQALFYVGFPRTALLTLIPKSTPLIGPLTGGVKLYAEGFAHGAVQALRFGGALTAGLTVVWTTEPRDLLVGLVRLRTPYGIAFMVTTALRFIPQMAEEARKVLLARRLRGEKLWNVNPLRTLMVLSGALRPLLAANLRRAAGLADAAEVRAFDGTGERTSLRAMKIGWAGRLLSGGLVGVLASVICAKLLYLLYSQGIFYSASLRWVYHFSREFL